MHQEPAPKRRGRKPKRAPVSAPAGPAAAPEALAAGPASAPAASGAELVLMSKSISGVL